MPNTREKLIELLKQGADNTPCSENCWDKKCVDCIRETTADHLIANGVTVLPCNVGQTIWLVYTPKHPADPNDKGKWFIEQDGVQRVIFGAKGVSIETWNMGTIPGKEIGKKLFFTKEEAEAVFPQPPKGE